MKRILILLFALMASSCIFSQKISDARLLDKVKAQVGQDVEQQISSSATHGPRTIVHTDPKTGVQSRSTPFGIYVVNLNNGIRYRFTVGNSEQSAGTLTVRLFMSKEIGDILSPIKSMEVKPGDISSFEFLCTQTGRYGYYYDYTGDYQCAAVISKVKTEK